jgi:hypothetical protein
MALGGHPIGTAEPSVIGTAGYRGVTVFQAPLCHDRSAFAAQPWTRDRLPSPLDQHLAPFRLCMLFMAAPELPDDLKGDWPALWARGEDETWRRVDFGRSLQARRLACMLVLSPQGVRAKQAGRALSLDGIDGKGERQNAKRYLGEALSRVGANDLLVLPDRGGRGTPPWALRHATTDVALAAAAAGREDWVVAAHFTHGGIASLVGIGEPGSRGRGGRRRSRCRRSATVARPATAVCRPNSSTWPAKRRVGSGPTTATGRGLCR